MRLGIGQTEEDVAALGKPFCKLKKKQNRKTTRPSMARKKSTDVYYNTQFSSQSCDSVSTVPEQSS